MTVRILIVDDSEFFRGILKDVLGRHAGFEVVGEAGDGARAIDLVAQLKPDVVTMDVLLPLVGGLAAIKGIMARRPTAIVVLSRLVGRDERLGLDAMAAGAIDVLEKPLTGVDGGFERRLVELIRGAARSHLASAAAPRPPARPKPKGLTRVIGLVASTGGPQLLRRLLAALPRSFPLPIVIVQHTIDGFACQLASWLADGTALPVTVACAGDRLTPGRVVIAPDAVHVEVDAFLGVRLRGGPAEAGHRPSGSVLLRSLARSFEAAAMGVVLTGMGHDGADGLRELAKAGGTAVVQDPDDAVIDAMPRHAHAAATGATVVTAAELPALLIAAGRGGGA
ncbi:MAG TPA: chemotaxis protein CheB [Kofleriaceae bacterium]|nr:chemotaxis protein CheB [Kofleriaceae bacterium]